ncbi:hypothetical protein N7U49_46395 [Streptomyces sp. AD2-2]|nr:hypothetical protein N7U49_46395 [Streptomyces sp. AD2-2]
MCPSARGSGTYTDWTSTGCPETDPSAACEPSTSHACTTPWYVTPLTVDRGTPMETVIPAGGGLGTVRQVGLLSLPQSAPAGSVGVGSARSIGVSSAAAAAGSAATIAPASRSASQPR